MTGITSSTGGVFKGGKDHFLDNPPGIRCTFQEPVKQLLCIPSPPWTTGEPDYRDRIFQDNRSFIVSNTDLERDKASSFAVGCILTAPFSST
jgi:hypothetical protein